MVHSLLHLFSKERNIHVAKCFALMGLQFKFMHLFHLYYEICCLLFMQVILKCWGFSVQLGFFFFCSWSWVKFVAVLTACGNSFHIFIHLKNMSSPFYSFGTKFFCARGIPYNIDPRFSRRLVLIPWIHHCETCKPERCPWGYACCKQSQSCYLIVPQVFHEDSVRQIERGLPGN